MPRRPRMPSRLLVVDRDPRYAEWLCHHLEALCPDATVTSVTIHGLDRLQETLSDPNCDVLMLSAPFGSSPEDPEALGIELLRQLREKSGAPPVIIVAEEGNELTAVRALQLG